MRRLLAVFLLALTACGGGGTGPAVAPDAPPATSLIVIGNSITRTPPSPGFGWAGDWGMAASDAAHDFAHLAAGALGLPLDARNFSALETDLDVAQVPAMATGVAGAVVVVQLGDNAGSSGKTPAQWRSAYRALLDATRGVRTLVCVTTFWGFGQIDAVIREECTAHGGRVAEIGDIYPDAANPDRQEVVSANDAVNQHPHDYGMARIAERVVAAAR